MAIKNCRRYTRARESKWREENNNNIGSRENYGTHTLAANVCYFDNTQKKQHSLFAICYLSSALIGSDALLTRYDASWFRFCMFTRAHKNRQTYRKTNTCRHIQAHTGSHLHTLVGRFVMSHTREPFASFPFSHTHAGARSPSLTPRYFRFEFFWFYSIFLLLFIVSSSFFGNFSSVCMSVCWRLFYFPCACNK